MKKIAIIQARTNSTRLPGKVMMQLVDKTVLAHDIERIKQSKMVDEIVIATTTSEVDDQICEEAKKYGVSCYRGSERDVLSRYYDAASHFNADIIIRLTSDCPLLDPFLVDEMSAFFLENEYEIVTNAGSDISQRTFPRGLDIEIFSYQSLKIANQYADKEYQREHVTPFIYENTDNLYYYKDRIDNSFHRWTLDTKEDWELINAIYESLYKGKHDFYYSEIIKLFDENPELININKSVEQKKVY